MGMGVKHTERMKLMDSNGWKQSTPQAMARYGLSAIQTEVICSVCGHWKHRERLAKKIGETPWNINYFRLVRRSINGGFENGEIKNNLT